MSLNFRGHKLVLTSARKVPDFKKQGRRGDPEQTRMLQSKERDGWADEAYIGATGLVQKINLHPMK